MRKTFALAAGFLTFLSAVPGAQAQERGENRGREEGNRGNVGNAERGSAGNAQQGDRQRDSGRRFDAPNQFYRGEYPDSNGYYYQGQQGRRSGYYGQEYYGQEFSAQARSNDNRVLVRVDVPSPSAKIWFEGEATQQQGYDRLYISPPIEPGKNYSYTIKASWMENGREVTQEKKLQVHANDQVAATFTGRGQGQEPILASPTRADTIGRQELSEPKSNLVPPTIVPEGDHTLQLPASATGKIVSIKGERITISDEDGGNERSFQMPQGTSFTLDGKDVGQQSLKAGMHVSVNLKQGTQDQASKIEVNAAAPSDKR
jgi:uncharacterized protein (TIGR03000 family)